MSKRGYIIIGLLAIVIGAGTFRYVRSRGPYINGKPLSQWVELSHSGQGTEVEEAQLVIHNLGTNYVPVLLKWLEPGQFTGMDLQDRLVQWRVESGGWLMRHHYIRHQLPWLAGRLRLARPILVLLALPNLNHDARLVAVRGLIPKLSVKGNWASMEAMSLTQMAPESVSPIIECLANPDPKPRLLAIRILGDIGPPAAAAVPALKQIIAGSDHQAVLVAARSLEQIGCDSSVYVPVVLRELENAKDFETFNYLLRVLSSRPGDLKQAAPVLQEILDKTADSKDQNGRMIHERVGDELQGIRGIPDVSLP